MDNAVSSMDDSIDPQISLDNQAGLYPQEAGRVMSAPSSHDKPRALVGDNSDKEPVVNERITPTTSDDTQQAADSHDSPDNKGTCIISC